MGLWLVPRKETYIRVEENPTPLHIMQDVSFSLLHDVKRPCFALLRPATLLEEDYLDTQIEWMRSVTDGAPVERTFIQFNTNLKAEGPEQALPQTFGRKKHRAYSIYAIYTTCLSDFVEGC